MKKKRNNSLSFERLFSKEAEAAVLGSILIDPQSINRVLPKIPDSEAFYLVENKTIYEALIKLYTKNKPIDAVSLRTELIEQDKLEEVGGVEYIAKVMQSVPSSANAGYYAGIVKTKEKERQVIIATRDIGEVINEAGHVDEKIQQIQKIALQLEPTNKGTEYSEVKNEATNVAVNMRDNRDEAIATGFRDIDWWLHGYYPGEFIILAGRPSMGKSALALDMALNMAEQGTPVFISTLEMPVKSIIERALCSLASVDMVRLRSGEATDKEWAKVYEQSFVLQGRNVILSTVAYTPEQFAGLLHSLKRMHNVGIAFIDYLQLMYTVGRKNENRQQEMSEISRSLKRTALRENVPIVALSQLNRQVDSREDHRPRMSDLRESGSLEQDADLVQFIYRDDYYHNNETDYEPTGIAEFITAKNRRGRTGKVELVFVHDYVKFANMSREFL